MRCHNLDIIFRVVEKEMIPGWLRLSNNNIVQLLHHLDVGNSDQDTKQGAKSAPAGALNCYNDLDTYCFFIVRINAF